MLFCTCKNISSSLVLQSVQFRLEPADPKFFMLSSKDNIIVSGSVEGKHLVFHLVSIIVSSIVGREHNSNILLLVVSKSRALG